MLQFFIILIFLLAFPLQAASSSWECPEGRSLVITSPHPGTHTLRDRVSVRGYLCKDYRLVLVRNRTTDSLYLADMQEACDHEQCLFTFLTIVEDLALGPNELTATVLHEETAEEVRIEVIRTALASLSIGPF